VTLPEESHPGQMGWERAGKAVAAHHTEAAAGRRTEAAEGSQAEAAEGRRTEATEGRRTEAAEGRRAEAAVGRRTEAAEGRRTEAAGRIPVARNPVGRETRGMQAPVGKPFRPTYSGKVCQVGSLGQSSK
jgi:hypothetical protein